MLIRKMDSENMKAFNEEIKRIESLHSDELCQDLNLYFDLIFSSERLLHWKVKLSPQIRGEITLAVAKYFPETV